MIRNEIINIQFIEDENGTHIMSPNDMCIIDELQEMIDAGVDVIKN